MGERTFLRNIIVKCAACNHANIFNQPYPYHAGFSDMGFLYNDAGNLTLTWSCYDPAFGAIVGEKNPWVLTLIEQKKLEDALLPAPSGGRWRFSNSARCLRCNAPISDPIGHSAIGHSIRFLLYNGSVQTFDPTTGIHALNQQLNPNDQDVRA